MDTGLNQVTAFTDASFNEKLSGARRNKVTGGIVYCIAQYPMYGFMLNCSGLELKTSDNAELFMSLMSLALASPNDRVLASYTDSLSSVDKLYDFQRTLKPPSWLSGQFAQLAASKICSQGADVDFEWRSRTDDPIRMAHLLATRAKDIEKGVQRVTIGGRDVFTPEGPHVKWAELVQ